MLRALQTMAEEKGTKGGIATAEITSIVKIGCSYKDLRGAAWWRWVPLLRIAPVNNLRSCYFSCLCCAFLLRELSVFNETFD